MKHYLKRVAFFFRYAWIFSFFINITLLLSPLYMLQIYDRVLTSRSLQTLAMLTLGMAFATLVYVFLETLRSRILVQAGLALDAMLSHKVLDEVFAKATHIGGVRYASAIRDVAVVRQYLTGNGLFAFFDAPWAFIFLGIIFIMHWALGVTALIGMLILLILAVVDEKKTRRLLLEANSLARESSHYVDAALKGAESIAAMGMRDAVLARWQVINNKVLLSQSTASDRSGVIVATTKGVRTMLQTLMLGLGAYLVITENLSSGIMIAATILLGKATAPIELAISGWKGFIDTRAAYQRLNKLLEHADRNYDTLSLPEPEGNIVAERLVFSIAQGQPAIIKGVSFSLAAGECMAVIGPSAAGKSTLVRLLLGIWYPQSGTVRIDGANLADWSDKKIGPHIGYLPQDIELFSGTVAENIARMNESNANSEAIISAAKVAGAHDMILRLPQGYETQIGENGVSLSGGQRQRIGLARALYKLPKFIVLDEPNSNLDAEGELALIMAIRQLKLNQCTVIFVTHKPSLVAYADKLLVLENGNVAAFGNKDAVLAQMQANQAKASSANDQDSKMPQVVTS